MIKVHAAVHAWKWRGWSYMIGVSPYVLGLAVVIHCWGDYGFNCILGPFAFSVDGPKVPEIGVINEHTGTE